MSITFDKALGVHQDALRLRGQRTQILANNLANADTPGFKAKDIDFNELLKDSHTSKGFKMAQTNSDHIALSQFDDADTMYRIPMQPSVDGNTVNEQVEISKFSDNSLRYMASLRFLSDRFKGMMTAIKGE